MEPSKAVKEYKEEIDKLNITVDEYAKKVGQLIVEKCHVSPRCTFFPKAIS